MLLLYQFSVSNFDDLYQMLVNVEVCVNSWYSQFQCHALVSLFTVGRPKAKVVSGCMSAIKNNEVDLLFKIIRNGMLQLTLNNFLAKTFQLAIGETANRSLFCKKKSLTVSFRNLREFTSVSNVCTNCMCCNNRKFGCYVGMF